MYFWNKYPFIRFSFALIIGILAFEYVPEWWNQSLTILFSLLLVFVLLLLLSNRLGHFKFRHLYGTIALLIIFFLGGSIKKKKYAELSSIHYINSPAPEFFEGRVINSVTERKNHFRYELELIQAYVQDSVIELKGKIHLYIKKDTISSTLIYGDKVFVAGSYFPIPEPQNPHEFDYKSYLAKKNIYSQAFVTRDQVKFVDNQPPNQILHYSFAAREWALRSIDRNIKSERENAIAKALLLGVKDYLDNDLKKSYSSAGAMHVLAVSGLHVGIIYLIIHFLFTPIRNTKRGKIIFGFVSIGVIWSYALITGMSPSVLRASTMFSVVAISQMRVREGNIYNTLGFAAFILLLFDPNLIYSVGFQLSFAAVFGIVYLQPKLYRLIIFNHWITDKAWAITCVSIAAQLATFPLSAYYFHQFPTYFLVSNLIVIPAATLILSIGIAMLFLDAMLPILGGLLGKILNMIIWTVNESVLWVEKLPHSLVEWIYLDRVELFLVYAFVIALISGFHFRSFKTFFVSAVIILSLSGWRARVHFSQAQENELIFYEVKNRTLIDHISGLKATLFVDEKDRTNSELLSFQINPNRLKSHLDPIESTSKSFDEIRSYSNFDSFQLFEIASKKILVIDSTTFHLQFSEPIRCDVLLIENESVKSLNWLQDHFVFYHLVIGNKNSIRYANRIINQAVSLNVPIHSIRTSGAFTLDLKK